MILRHTLISLMITVSILFAGALCLREASASLVDSSQPQRSAKEWEKALKSSPSSEIHQRWWQAGAQFEKQFSPAEWASLKSVAARKKWRTSRDAEATFYWIDTPSSVSMGFRLSPQLGSVVLLASSDGSPQWRCPVEGCTITASFGAQRFYFRAFSPQGAGAETAVLGIEPISRVVQGLQLSPKVAWELPAKDPKYASVTVNAAGWEQFPLPH